MGRTVCTEPQCLYSRAIPLLPLWTVRPVQSSVPVQWCTSCRWVINLTSWSLYSPGKNSDILWRGGWMDPRFNLDVLEKRKCACAGIRTPYLPARSRLTIPITAIRMRSGLECPKYPYSDLIHGVKVTHLFKIRVELTMSDTIEYGPVRFWN
jgi:hypothetical protein